MANNKYGFESKKPGDTVQAASRKERALMLSAFWGWKWRNPGSLAISSKMNEDKRTYTITFFTQKTGL